MNKIISYLAIVVLSVAGFSAAAKEASNAQQNTLANLDTKAVELAASIEKVQKQLSELDAQKNERMKVEIERDRKGIEFWFAALAILTTIVAALGALLPFLMARKDKERLQSEFEEARRLTSEARISTEKANGLAEESRLLVDSIREQHTVAEKTTSEISKFKDFVSGKETTEAEKQEVALEVQEIAENPRASDVDKLRARAIAASQIGDRSIEQAMETYELWKALTVIYPEEASAHFNSGYWAQQIVKLSNDSIQSVWSEKAIAHYEKVIEIEPKDAVALHNLAVALESKALALSKVDSNLAQSLWQQVSEKCALVLKIDPNKHDAAKVWGNALSAQAIETAKTSSSQAILLFQKAEDKYALALKIKPTKQDAAYNWGYTLNLLAIEIAKTNLNDARVVWQRAGEKFALALSIQPDLDEAANGWGAALCEEAHAIAKTEPADAQALRIQARDKYVMALKLKPNKHEVANNLSTVLIHLHNASLPTDRDFAKDALSQALVVLEKHSAMDENGRKIISFNLACIYGLLNRPADAVSQLEISRLANNLPEHWLSDADLNLIRASDEYKTWYKTHFGDDKT